MQKTFFLLAGIHMFYTCIIPKITVDQRLKLLVKCFQLWTGVDTCSYSSLLARLLVLSRQSSTCNVSWLNEKQVADRSGIDNFLLLQAGVSVHINIWMMLLSIHIHININLFSHKALMFCLAIIGNENIRPSFKEVDTRPPCPHGNGQCATQKKCNIHRF